MSRGKGTHGGGSTGLNNEMASTMNWPQHSTGLNNEMASHEGGATFIISRAWPIHFMKLVEKQFLGREHINYTRSKKKFRQ